MTRTTLSLALVLSIFLAGDTEPKERTCVGNGAIVQGHKFLGLQRLRTATHSEAIVLLNELGMYIREEKRNDRPIEVASILTTLEPLIRSNDPEVAHAALYALAELRHDVRPLNDSLKEIATSEFVSQLNRLAALECIYKSGHEPSIFSTSNVLMDDPDLEIRFWATFLLVIHDRKDVQVAMPVFLEALNDPTLQDPVISVFGYLGERARPAGPALRNLQGELNSFGASTRKKNRLRKVIRIVDGLEPAWDFDAGW